MIVMNRNEYVVFYVFVYVEWDMNDIFFYGVRMQFSNDFEIYFFYISIRKKKFLIKKFGLTVILHTLGANDVTWFGGTNGVPKPGACKILGA